VAKRNRAAPDFCALLDPRSQIRGGAAISHFREAILPSAGYAPAWTGSSSPFCGRLCDRRYFSNLTNPALERRNLVPEITAALAVESDDKARGSMELDLRMLRDGHWVEPESPGRIRVTVRLHNGIRSRTLSDQELQTKGLEAILAELRA